MNIREQCWNNINVLEDFKKDDKAFITEVCKVMKQQKYNELIAHLDTINVGLKRNIKTTNNVWYILTFVNTDSNECKSVRFNQNPNETIAEFLGDLLGLDIEEVYLNGKLLSNYLETTKGGGKFVGVDVKYYTETAGSHTSGLLNSRYLQIVPEGNGLEVIHDTSDLLVKIRESLKGKLDKYTRLQSEIFALKHAELLASNLSD